jgi:hypothetical protein
MKIIKTAFYTVFFAVILWILIGMIGSSFATLSLWILILPGAISISLLILGISDAIKIKSYKKIGFSIIFFILQIILLILSLQYQWFNIRISG